jgi:hypothetical protein
MLAAMSAKRWAAAIAAGAVAFAGLTNAHAHLHFCFDGADPPAAVHLVDPSNHLHDHFSHLDDHFDHFDDHTAASEHHDDLDLDVQDPALAKTLKHDVAAIDAGFGPVSIAGASAAEALPRAAEIEPHPPPAFSRPLSRAPPL